MKRKMGRPTLPANKARKVYPLRLSSDEMVLFKKAASIDKIGLPKWIRKSLTLSANQTISNTESGGGGS
jgi:hypothetical protein